MDAYIKKMPLFYEFANKSSLNKKPFNEAELLSNLLNFYTALYNGQMTKALWNDGTFMGISLPPEEKKELQVEYNTQLLFEEDREEVAKIIDYLELRLHIKKPIHVHLKKKLYKLYESMVRIFKK
jgi:hypothetical protein